ncbi:MAG: aldose epimerase family protein [Acidobacteriota bacterium]
MYSEDHVHLVRRGKLRATFMSLGATIMSLEAPDREGRLADVVLGFDDPASYVGHRGCLGAVVGRVANRISNARFTLDGRTYQLPTTAKGVHIHGGPHGFDKQQWWIAAESVGPDSTTVLFAYASLDGEEGYPGNCSATVRYALTDTNQLIVDYTATTDKPTPVNLSQHVYFNLAGQGAGDVLGHRARLRAGCFTPVDARLIPTGEIWSLDDSPLDFRAETPIGDRIDAPDEQLRLAGGYDHNYVIDRPGPGLIEAGRVWDPASGRTLTVSTTEPGVQFYTANNLDGTQVGKGGRPLTRRSGFCLETQHYPDSPNLPSFPSVVLRPGDTYRSRTVFQFGVEA